MDIPKSKNMKLVMKQQTDQSGIYLPNILERGKNLWVQTITSIEALSPSMAVPKLSDASLGLRVIVLLLLCPGEVSQLVRILLDVVHLHKVHIILKTIQCEWDIVYYLMCLLI